MSEQAFLTAITSSLVTAALPGGAYSLQALGPMGLAKNNPLCAAAWANNDGFLTLRTCAVVKISSTTPLYQRSDVESQETGIESFYEVWVYSWDGHVRVQAAAAAIYRRLQLQPYAGLGHVRLVNERPTLYDAVNNDTPMGVFTYSARHVRRVT